MRSKNWCCKLSLPLIRKDVTRFWPIWATYFAVWFLILPVPFFTNMESYGRSDLISAIYRHVVNCGTEIALVLSAIGGVAAAFFVWSYLFQGRSASLFHALPVTRETLFLSHWTAGLGFLLVPNALIAGISYLFQMALGYFDPTILLRWLLVVNLQCLLFYSIGTLCAMFTGSLPAMPVLYGLVNFAAVIIEALMHEFSTMLYYGIRSLEMRFTAFSPFFRLIEQDSNEYRNLQLAAYEWLEVKDFHPEYVKILCLYGLVALVLTVCALLLYRKRTTECAGDVIAVPWLKPIAKYVFALGCALVLGWVLHEILFGGEGHPLAIIPCLLAGAAVGYLAAAMLLKKSFRVFSAKQMTGLLCLCLALTGWVLAVDADLFGVEHRIPRQEDIMKIELVGDYSLTLKDPSQFPAVLELHRSILEAGEQTAAGGQSLLFFRLDYTLQDGSTLNRRYYLPYDAALLADAGSPIGKLKAIMDDPLRIRDNLLPEAGAFLQTMNLYLRDVYVDLAVTDKGFRYESCVVDTADRELLLQALETDILRGQLGGWLRESSLKYDTSEAQLSMEFEYLDSNGNSQWKSVQLSSLDAAPATRQALVALGYLTKAPVEVPYA